MSISWHIKIVCFLATSIALSGVSTPNLIMPFNTPAAAKKTEILSRITQKLSEREIFSVAEKQALRAVPTFIKNLIKDADPQLITEFIALQESFGNIVRKLDTIEEETSVVSRDTQTVKQLIGVLLDIAKEVQPTVTRAVGDVIFTISVTIKDKILEVLELLELLSDLSESFSETLESLIDIVIADINIDFAGTFTMLNALESKLDILTSNTNCSITASCDFSGTYTAIAAVQNTVNIDFAGTWTSLAAIQNTVNVDFAGTFTMLDALESKLDILILTSNTTCRACDLSGTYTALAALQNTINVDFAGTWTAIAALQNTVNVDFAGTWTVLAAIQNLINVDFAGTYTAIAALQNTVNVDFAGTWTMIEALEQCEPVCLTQANFAGGTFTASTQGISYRLAEDVTGNLNVTAADVTLDLNEHALGGTVILNAARAIIQNGKIISPVPANAGEAAIETVALTATSTQSQLLDCYIAESTSGGSNVPGRSAVNNAAPGVLIQNCYIRGGSAISGSSVNAGGTGIINSGSRFQIIASKIAGGLAGDKTGGGTAGAGGSAIRLDAGSNNVTMSDCQITGGNGGRSSASGTNAGNGGRGIDMVTATMVKVARCEVYGGNGGSVLVFGSTGSGGSAAAAIALDAVQNILIENCILFGGTGANFAGAPGVGNGGDGGDIFLVTNGNRVTIDTCSGAGGSGGSASTAPTGIAGRGGEIVRQLINAPSHYSVTNSIFSTGAGGSGRTGGRGGHGFNLSSMVSAIIDNTVIKQTGAGGNSTLGLGGAGGNGFEIGAGSSFVQISNDTINRTGTGGTGTATGTAGKAINDQSSSSIIYNNFAYNIANATAYTLGSNAAVDQPNGTAFLSLLTISTAHGYLNVHKP